LIAEDDRVSRAILKLNLEKWGYEVNAGADDYLTKAMDPQELELRLRAGRRILDLQSELIAAREGPHIQATHDSLTGVANRRAVLETLESEVVRAVRQHVPLGVILADLDHFKSINDAHRHAVGDTVLREAASRMVAALRPYDRLGRYGGKNFSS